eukprot:gene11496-biopygen15421
MSRGGQGRRGAWRGRGAGYRLRLGKSGAGVARAWRGRGAGISWVRCGRMVISPLRLPGSASLAPSSLAARAVLLFAPHLFLPLVQ